MISFFLYLFYDKNENNIKICLMYFYSNLKISIKQLKIDKDIIFFKNKVIDNYKSTFNNEDSPYFIKHFNIYIDNCIKLKKVSKTLETDINTFFNEDWKLLSLKIVKEFQPIYLLDIEKQNK